MNNVVPNLEWSNTFTGYGTIHPYTVYTDASKYAWPCVLMQEYEHEIEGKITYASGLFKGSQINWATLTK